MKWSSWHIDGREVFFRVPDVLLWWQAVSNWNLMQRLSFYTKSICSCWASALGQSPPQTMLKSCSTDLTHRKSMHLRQKTHKRVKASWWTLISVRSAVSLRQASPESSWIRTLAVHLEPLTETGDCHSMSGPNPPLGHPMVRWSPNSSATNCSPYDLCILYLSPIKRWAVEAKRDVCFWRSRARALFFLDFLGFIWIRTT